ncbi:carbohydrate ABC transporter permease [Tengunoibacter tsumagoiensis]|uniref:Putative ABC transporter permease protein YurN n=1 Tax=Tengunoibacter tsumagoiensis TaxID=2014871 RepID=A0A401ZVJ7_9CHLR|nr:sugar ABC transporter permease [Tengunoibacter tsumagoiensis]GCE10770.1 putative ABC transporter permease protein YurN [Tengunoibacter tsumagoiensis]
MVSPTLLQPKDENRPKRIVREPQKRSLWHEIRSGGWSYLYVAPMFILLVVFAIYPSFASLGYTLYQWNGIGDPTVFVGLDNFNKVMHDPFFWKAFSNTFVYMLVLVPVQLTLALALALVLNNPKLRFASVYRAIFFIPVVTSAAVIAVVVQLIMSTFGDDINKMLINLHIIQQHIDWLGDPHFALGIVIVIGIWNTLGYNLIYFLAGLQTIPLELYEAARMDGANAINRFFSITVPMLRSVGLIILILAILGSLQVFDIVLVLTDGGPYGATEVVNTYIYHQAFGGNSRNPVEPNVGFASAASFFYGVVIMGISVAQLLLFRYLNRQRQATMNTVEG